MPPSRFAGFAPLKQLPKVLTNEQRRALPSSRGGEEPGQLQTWRTDAFTIFTDASGRTVELYAAEQWVRIKLSLETAGPVAVGPRADLAPLLSGQGILLDTDETYETYVPKGTRFYYIAETVNRLQITVEPVPWMEQIDYDIVGVRSAIESGFKMLAGTLLQALQSMGAIKPPPTTPSGQRVADLPNCPPGRPVQLPRTVVSAKLKR